MSAISFNLGTVLSSAGSGLVFALGVAAADYTAAGGTTQQQDSQASARVYTALTLPASALNWASAKATDLRLDALWSRSEALDEVRGLVWGVGARVDARVDFVWERGYSVDPATWSLAWGRAFAADADSTSLPWGSNVPRDSFATSLPWGWASIVDGAAISVKWRELAGLEASWSLAWGRGFSIDLIAQLPYLEGPPLDSDAVAIPWNAAQPVQDYLISPLVNPGEVELPPLELQKGRGFACFHLGKTRSSNFNSYVLNRRINNDQCFPGAFVVNNTLSAKTMHDNLPLSITAFSASTDIGATAWDYSIGLPTLAELTRVKPTVSGPIEVEVTLNGYVFRVLVEAYDEARAQGSWGYTANGRGLTAYAASPFAPLASAVRPAAPRLASQLCEDALVSTGGFTVNWEPLNYLVQPNMLSYSDADPVGVLSRVANAVGAVVIPHRYNKEFTVKSRYPVSPWDWVSPATPISQVISKSLIIKASGRFVPNPTFNKVYVSATSAGYVAGVRRDGTAGDKLAPQVTEALLSQPVVAPTAAGNLERGRIEISRSGPRREYTIITPLVAANITPGVRLKEPTELVEVEDDEGLYRAMVGKVAVAATADATGKLTVYQNLGLERYV